MEGDKFPIGLKVLLVDDDIACLRIIESLLIDCKYKVTIATEAISALEMLRENKNRFDIVITDVHMPMMDGFKLLELIGLELDLPVIRNDNLDLVMKGVKHGVVDYLVKPVRLEELKNIWQHVARKNLCKGKGKAIDVPLLLPIDGHGNANPEEESSRKRREKKAIVEDEDREEGEEEEEEEEEDEALKEPKKNRFVWSCELHKKFVFAVRQLSPDNVFPKKILDFMDADGLTREIVASHLQKYRIFLKKMSKGQPTGATSAPFESSSYMNGELAPSTYMNGPLAPYNYMSTALTPSTHMSATLGPYTYMSGAPLPNSYGVHCSLSNQINGLSLTSSSNQALATNVGPNIGVPSLEDYKKKMEIWKNSSILQQVSIQGNQLLQKPVQGNELPFINFNGISYVQNALENPFPQVPATTEYYFPSHLEHPLSQMHATPEYYFPLQNVAYNIEEANPYNMDNLMISNTGSLNQSLECNNLTDSVAGQMDVVSTSSFVENAEVQVQDNEGDALMPVEEHILGSSGMLEDIVNGVFKKDDLLRGAK